MPSYYNKVTGTLDAGKTARSGDIHLIQSSIQEAMRSMISDMFGTGFVLGEAENALKLYSTSEHRDQYNNNNDENTSSISLLDTYLKQPIIIEKSSIESITIEMQNTSHKDVTVFAEIRDSNSVLIQETNTILSKEPALEYQPVKFNFNLHHLPVGLYYFILRPIDISATDLTVNGDETPYDTITSDMFLVKYDTEGGYQSGLQASLDGSTYLDASILLEETRYDDNGYTVDVNPDLVFEQIYSSGNTYLITKGSAVVLGEKVFPLDTHVTIDGPSIQGDRTDLVTLTTDGRLNVINGNTYTGTKQYPIDDTGLKIAYITTYRNNAATWICPNCENTNEISSVVCAKCHASAPTSFKNTKMPTIEQADDNGTTRNRDVIERLRRLEKKINYQEQHNSPTRIKYNCTVDPILITDEDNDDAYIRGEGTYKVSSQNDGTQTTITSDVGIHLAWSIIQDHYTYNSATNSSANAVLTLYDCATTTTQPKDYDASKNAKGQYTVHIEAMELLEDATIENAAQSGTPIANLPLQLQIKKGGDHVDIISITTNEKGSYDLALWSKKLSAGKYNIYLLYEGEQITKASLTIYGTNEEINSKIITTLSPHTEPVTIVKDVSGTVTKTLPDGVISGNDSFYTEHMKVDTTTGQVKVSKISHKNDWTVNTLLKDLSTFDSQDMQYKINYGNSLTSEYPLLHFEITKDTTIESITPYISGFQNISEFGILIFKNDTVFDMVNNTRQVMTKYINKLDANFPTIYDSGFKSLKDLVTQSNNWKILKNQVTFDINKDFDAGVYTLMVYGKVEDNQTNGIIKIKQYHTYENTKKYGIAAKSLGSSKLSLIYMDTSSLTDWSWDVQIKQTATSYYDKGILISKPIKTITPIKACNISKNLIIPDGCDAELWVANNGNNFIKVNGNSVTFNNEGNTFKWKLVFYATASKTPVLKFGYEQQYAISFTLGTTIDYLEYEDYHQCYETPLINANAVTRIYTNSEAKDMFGGWEYARIFMNDEELQSKIDICIAYAYDNYDTHVYNAKKYWGRDIFFNTIFANLSLEDFSQESVDYSNYNGDVEYDEHNFLFNLNNDYSAQTTGGTAIASPDIISSKYHYGNINENPKTIEKSFSYKFVNTSYEYTDNYKDATKVYAGMHTTNGPYYLRTRVSNDTYSRSDVIAGITFPSGIDIDEKMQNLTIGIYCGIDTTKHTASYIDKDNNCYYPKDTFEIVLATNPYGDVNENEAHTGMIYKISNPLKATMKNVDEEEETTNVSDSLGNSQPMSNIAKETYNEITIPLNDYFDLTSTTTIYSIGIRAIDPNTAMAVGDTIGIGVVKTSSYNIRPYVPYTYTGSDARFKWTSLKPSNKKCKAFSTYELTSERQVFYPISEEDSKNTRTITESVLSDDYDNFNPGEIATWSEVNSSYEQKELLHGTIERQNSTITTTVTQKNGTIKKGKYVTTDSSKKILFELPEGLTGNLFKIKTDIPFTVYDLIDVQYTMFCERITRDDQTEDQLNSTLLIPETGESIDFINHSNVRRNDDSTIYWRTDGSFSKGEIILDLYETTDINNADPIESLPLPAWGRTATQSTVDNKIINAWFKKHTSSTKIKCIVLRRADPRNLKDKLPRIRLMIHNILFFNSEQQLALGPQMQMRIYPNAIKDAGYSNTKIRKYGAIYRLK